MKKRIALFALALCAAAGSLLVLTRHQRHAAPLTQEVVRQESPLPTKTTDLKSFVQLHKDSRDEETQDRVGAARIRLAYASAAKKDWPAARATLLETAKDYKGTNSMSSDFGGVSDQASYQAAVCLIAEGKKAEGRRELVTFMRSQPLSPLATAAFRRIQRLDGRIDPEVQGLLQKDIAAQEAHVRFENSVCGPRCIERLVATGAVAHGADAGYKQIAKLCGTTDKGTTVEQMIGGLSKLGTPAYGYSLNARDLTRAPLPLILLSQDHYVVMEKREGGVATLFDPRFKSAHEWELPVDDKFRIPVILLSQPNFLKN